MVGSTTFDLHENEQHTFTFMDEIKALTIAIYAIYMIF